MKIHFRFTRSTRRGLFLTPYDTNANRSSEFELVFGKSMIMFAISPGDKRRLTSAYRTGKVRHTRSISIMSLSHRARTLLKKISTGPTFSLTYRNVSGRRPRQPPITSRTVRTLRNRSQSGTRARIRACRLRMDRERIDFVVLFFIFSPV